MAKPHVVVLPLPTRGHVNPMMHFSKILASLGCTITFVNTEFNAQQMGSSPGLQQLHKSGLDIRIVQLPDGLPPNHGRTTNFIQLNDSVLSTMGDPFEKLVAGLMQNDPPVTCILADTWMVFGLDVAKKFGLAHASFWTQSATTFGILLRVLNGYLPPSDPKIPGTPFIEADDISFFVQSFDPSDFRFQFVSGGFDRLSESDWIFINTFDELEQETIQALRSEQYSVSTVGPLLPASFLDQSPDSSRSEEMITLWEEEERCLSWLDNYGPNSVLYVSFGSLMTASAQQIAEIALGLEASEYPFLWVVRSDLMLGEAAVFPQGFRERVKDRAEFVSWAPQLRVLRHSSVGGFFTHGGWNSTLEGITAGIPMLGWPFFSDQAINTKSLEARWKMGLPLLNKLSTGKDFSREEVKEKVKALMESIELRERARQWSSAAKEAILGHDSASSFTNVQSFVNDMKCTSSHG